MIHCPNTQTMFSKSGIAKIHWTPKIWDSTSKTTPGSITKRSLYTHIHQSWFKLSPKTRKCASKTIPNNWTVYHTWINRKMIHVMSRVGSAKFQFLFYFFAYSTANNYFWRDAVRYSLLGLLHVWYYKNILRTDYSGVIAVIGLEIS